MFKIYIYPSSTLPSKDLIPGEVLTYIGCSLHVYVLSVLWKAVSIQVDPELRLLGFLFYIP